MDTIEKNGKIYTVKECKNHWNISASGERVSVSYKIDKALCETREDLKQYIKENKMF